MSGRRPVALCPPGAIDADEVLAEMLGVTWHLPAADLASTYKALNDLPSPLDLTMSWPRGSPTAHLRRSPDVASCRRKRQDRRLTDPLLCRA